MSLFTGLLIGTKTSSPHLGLRDRTACSTCWAGPRGGTDRVRDDVRECLLEHLHDEDVVLAVDETVDLKKGTHTVGVQRQRTGTTGRIENARVAGLAEAVGGVHHA
ncbi:MAG: hypothetical protein QG671_3001 [Actinomycetota bacterium]|nr:hypothetical protein [Actinomycetota bacterium]